MNIRRDDLHGALEVQARTPNRKQVPPIVGRIDGDSEWMTRLGEYGFTTELNRRTYHSSLAPSKRLLKTRESTVVIEK